jgi:hypothetical protein
MAQLALGAAGAALGFAVGGPTGAHLGFLAGSTLGGVLFRPGLPEQRGPRLGDLSVTASTYGLAIARGFGTVRTGGNVIWSSGLKEVETRRSRRVGKGGQRQATVAYSYFASLAIAFGAGPAQALLRLWADGKLIYDATGTGWLSKGVVARFYPGSEDQLPDPLLQAELGAANTPAHRGLVYLVLEDLALADFGNRIPMITAEIAWSAAALHPQVSLPGGGTDSFAIDHHRGLAWSATTGRLDRYDLWANQRTATLDLGSNHLPPRPDPEGRVYLQPGASNSNPVHQVDPHSCQVVAGMGGSSNNLSYGNHVPMSAAIAFVDFPEWGERLLVLGGFLSPGRLGVYNRDQLALRVADNEGLGARIRHLMVDRQRRIWALGLNTGGTTTRLGRYRLTLAAGSDGPLFALDKQVWNLSTLAGIEQAAFAFYDGGDESIVLLSSASNRLWKWDIASEAVVAERTLGFTVDQWNTSHFDATLEDGTFFVEGVNRFARIRASDLVVLREWTRAEWGLSSEILTGGAWHPGSNSLLLRAGSTRRLYLDRVEGQGAALPQVVQDLAGLAGLGPADLDVGPLAEESVRGYLIGRVMSVRDALELLASAYLFDGVESDHKLRFVRRGGAAVATIPADHLGAGDAPLSPDRLTRLSETRRQEDELPARIEVHYLDRARDYQQGVQAARRISRPAPTMEAQAVHPLELPLVMEAEQAKRLAEVLLFATWAERTALATTLPPRYLRLDPADPVTIDAGAIAWPARLVSANLGANGVVALEAQAEDAGSYLPTSALADGGGGVPGQLVGVVPPVELFLCDLPLLQDIDGGAGTGTGLYLAVGALGPGWRAALIYRSSDDLDYAPVLAAAEAAVWGTLLGSLPPTSRLATWDRDTVITVRLAGGALESRTEGQVLDGANAALIGDEVVQFEEVSELGEGVVELRTLLRGRRGTEWVAAAGHPAGARFLLLTDGALYRLPLPLGELGQQRFWRAVSLGQLFEQAPRQVFTARGRDLMPYSPVQLRGVRDGEGSLTLTWIRRTRLGGEWRDGAGTVPLAEVTETYEVDILNGDEVVRTLAAPTPSALYTAAQQTSDFGSTQANVTVRIFQLSEAVGRGFPAEASL